MAAIEGIYLTDDKDNLIFEYPISSSFPSLKTILNTIVGIDSQHLRNDSIIEISLAHTIYKIKSNRVVFYALIQTPDKDDESLALQTLRKSTEDDAYSSDGYEDHDTQELKKPADEESVDKIVNPNSIFVFLNTINRVLIDYFGSPLNSLKIEANYDIMCNLMQELVEGGYPYITDANTLKELVPFQNSLSSKFLSTTNQLAKSYVNSSTSHTSLSSLSHNESSSKIPWRKANVKYTNNELFVDLKEEINVVLTNPKNNRISSSLKKNKYKSQKLIPTVAVIKGQIDFTSHLSGVPDIQLSLNLNGHHLGVPSFHRCIKTETWINNEGLLSFIPPDGKTTIMNYTIDLDQHPSSKIMRNLGLVNIDYKDGLGLKKNEFEITLNLNLYKNVSKVSNLKVLINTQEEGNLKTLRLSHGDLQTKSYGNFEWTFDQQTSLGINPVLRGTIEPYEDSGSKFGNSSEEVGEDQQENIIAKFPHSIALSYSNTGSLPSGIRVGSLRITRGMSEVKPYKGVKYITSTGDFMIR